MEEVWKDIIGFESFYSISNHGRCYSKRAQKCIKPSNNMSGYLFYNLCVHGISKVMYAHRLVAIHFLENKRGCLEVNHINGVRSDNNTSNLEWCTKHENSRHRADILKTKYKTRTMPSSYIYRKIVLYNEKNEAIRVFDSVKIASKELNINLFSIYSHMTGNRRLKSNIDIRYGDKVYIKRGEIAQ